MICQCIIHSNYSPEININNSKKKGLILQSKDTKLSNKVIKRLIKFFDERKYLGFSIIEYFMIKMKPGGSTHFGGSFEMSKDPNKFQTDILGRPFGLKKVHIVDASILPTLPAATIVYNTVANCIRITDRISKEIIAKSKSKKNIY